MNIVRQIKIANLIGHYDNINHKKLFDFVNDKLNNSEIKTLKHYPDSLFIVKDSSIVLEIDHYFHYIIFSKFVYTYMTNILDIKSIEIEEYYLYKLKYLLNPDYVYSIYFKISKKLEKDLNKDLNRHS